MKFFQIIESLARTAACGALVYGIWVYTQPDPNAGLVPVCSVPMVTGGKTTMF